MAQKRIELYNNLVEIIGVSADGYANAAYIAKENIKLYRHHLKVDLAQVLQVLLLFLNKVQLLLQQVDHVLTIQEVMC